VQKIYSSATDWFNRAISARAFSLLFFALAGLMTVVGLAINFGFAFSPAILPVLILVAAALWLACFVLQDKRQAIQEWLRKKVLAYSAPIAAVPSLKVSYRSTSPHSQHRPPRFTPRAKS